MGDRILITKIEFIHNELYQIDLYNETQKEHYRLFASKDEFESKLKAAKEFVGDTNESKA